MEWTEGERKKKEENGGRGEGEGEGFWLVYYRGLSTNMVCR